MIFSSLMRVKLIAHMSRDFYDPDLSDTSQASHSLTKLLPHPIKQQSWYKQIADSISICSRPIDKMSTLEISKMYQSRKFLCDTCNKELGRCDFTLEDHILHLINPLILWSCDDCIQKDLRSGNIFGMTEELTPHKWQMNGI